MRRLPLSDSRIPEIALEVAQPGGGVSIPDAEPALIVPAPEILAQRNGDVVAFIFIDAETGAVTETITACVDGEELVLFPDRSSLHRKLMLALRIGE